MTLKLTYNGQFNIENEDFYYFGTCTFIWCFRIVANEGTDSCPDFLSMTTFGPTLVKMVLTLTIITDCRHHFMMQHFLSEWVPAVKTPNLRAIFSGASQIHIVLDSTNKTTSFKFPLVFRGGLKIPWKNSWNRNATWYKWVLVTCWASTNTHLYHVALRFDEFFHGIFKTPQITNVNLIVAVLLVESNTMYHL